MSDSVITITVKLFAAYQEAYGVPELILKFPKDKQISIQQVCDRLICDHPQLAQWLDVTRFGINLNFVEADTLISDGDEVVFIPPVSGG
jgi:sulfur-carrier protein